MWIIVIKLSTVTLAEVFNTLLAWSYLGHQCFSICIHAKFIVVCDIWRQIFSLESDKSNTVTFMDTVAVEVLRQGNTSFATIIY